MSYERELLSGLTPQQLVRVQTTHLLRAEIADASGDRAEERQELYLSIRARLELLITYGLDSAVNENFVVADRAALNDD